MLNIPQEGLYRLSLLQYAYSMPNDTASPKPPENIIVTGNSFTAYGGSMTVPSNPCFLNPGDLILIRHSIRPTKST